MAQAVSRQPRKFGFIPRSVHMGHVEDRVVLEWVLLRALLFFPVSVIPPVLHTHLHLNVSLTSGTEGRSVGTFQQAVFFREPGAFCSKLLSHFSSLKL
jgi:hypothetical protein